MVTENKADRFWTELDKKIKNLNEMEDKQLEPSDTRNKTDKKNYKKTKKSKKPDYYLSEDEECKLDGVNVHSSKKNYGDIY